ncbi:hypothetical protein JCM10369A_27510 [Nocardioides pyridinolyticus]
MTKGDGTLWLVAGYNVAIAIVSLVCARLLPETRGRDLDEPWVEAPVSPRPASVRGTVASGSPAGR